MMSNLMDELLEKAIRIAVLAHYKQRDKAGKPYIYHLLHVMEKMRTPELKVIGVLHDLFEDHPENTPEMLIDKGFTLEIVDAIQTLTRRPKEDYWTYIGRVAAHPKATLVKLADLAHNMDLSRLPRWPTDEDQRMAAKYSAAYQALLSASVAHSKLAA